jgi:hypothetical protein
LFRLIFLRPQRSRQNRGELPHLKEWNISIEATTCHHQKLNGKKAMCARVVGMVMPLMAYDQYFTRGLHCRLLDTMVYPKVSGLSR